MSKDPYRYFRVEARDLLEQLGQGALDLEKDPENPQRLPRLLRLAHTLKGAARVVKQSEIADHAHAIEDILAPLRDRGATAARADIDSVLTLLDRIGAGLQALAPARQSASARAESTPRAGHVERPGLAELDPLLEDVAQAHARLAALQRELAEAERSQALADALAQRLAPRARRADGPGADPAHALAEELQRSLGKLAQQLGNSVAHIDRQLRVVRETAEQMRLVPAAVLFTSLERAVRDDARALGRDVEFASHGGDVRLDGELLGAVQGALLQMVRNAVAHGIEPAAERIASGKPGTGRVDVEVARLGRQVVFRCSDDGAGVNLDAVRQAAQRKGWLTPATSDLDAPSLLQLLMRGGISTASTITEVSGRGIGLDLIRDVVERLHGEVLVRTTAGRGTTVELHLPQAIASLDALVIETAGKRALIPLDSVRRTLRLVTAEIVRSAQGDSIVHDGQAIPYVPLAHMLSPKPGRRPAFASAVVVSHAGSLAAVGVDRLQGVASIVLRPLPELAPAAKIVLGASLDVDGNPQIVFDPQALVAQAQRDSTAPAPAEPAPVPLLVVDDSPTTRMLEKSILESAGYEVHAAVSAEEALEMAQRQRYALFLVDVEMPGMDGFTFVERTRADPALRDVPAILVTSRATAEDRRRGKQAGASGYIVKSEFEQEDFLRQVRELADAP